MKSEAEDAAGAPNKDCDDAGAPNRLGEDCAGAPNKPVAAGFWPKGLACWPPKRLVDEAAGAPNGEA